MGRERTRERTESEAVPEEHAVDDDGGGVLDLEQELSELPGAAAGIDDHYATGTILDARRVWATEVPDVYPIDVETEQAVAFELSIDGTRETTAYVEWPETYDEEADLAHLLHVLDVPPDRFGDVIGQDVDLKVMAGQWVIDIYDEPQPGYDAGEIVMDDEVVTVVRSDDGVEVRHDYETRQSPPIDLDGEQTSYYLVLGCILFWIQFLVLLFAGLPFFPGLQLLGVLFTSLLLPASVYSDSQHVAETTAWDPASVLWALGAVVPFLNFFVALAYVNKRRFAKDATGAR